jgi:uncharacterized protein (TIGR02099 family)
VTPTPKRRHLHRVRRWIQAIFATAIILLALGVGVIRLALPWIAAHPQHIANYLGKRLNRPVAIGSIEATWQTNGPLLSLRNVRLEPGKAGEQPFVIPQAELKVDGFAWLYRGRSLSEFRLVGLDLDLARDAAGNWALRGLNSGGTDDSQQNQLFDLGGLVLRDLHLRVNDAMTGRHLEVAADEVRLINDGSIHRAGARIRNSQGKAEPVDVVVEYDSDAHSGEAYLGGKNLDLAELLHDFPVTGTNVLSGAGRVQLWTSWRDDRLSAARAEVDLNGVVLEAAQPVVVNDKSAIAPRSAFDHIAFGARWQRDDGDWNADIADLVVDRQGIASRSARFHAEHRSGDSDTNLGYTATGERIELNTLVAVAILSDACPPALRSWLYAANPDGIVENAALRLDNDHDYDVSADLDDLTWHPVGRIPGVDGLTGKLLGDQDALTFRFPAHRAFGIELPHVFRHQLQFSEFSGAIAAYRMEALAAIKKADGPETLPRPSWRVETDRLVFEGDRYGGELRGGAEIHDDGTRPGLDVSALVTHAEVPASHLFWPLNIMPRPAMAWLDRALDGGHLADARAVIHGDLGDWPFRNFAGRFEARADIEDLRLKYLNEWPVAEHVHVLADFVNVGLHVDIDGGSVQSNKITAATADISDLGESQLDLNIDAQGAGHDLLTFVKATPIGQRFAAQLLGVEIGGQGKVNLRLGIPVKQADQFKMTGTANLLASDLSDSKYGLHFEKANGVVRFGRDGFAASDLSTTYEGQPARFGLLVGGFTADTQHVVEARLDANAPARSVLAYAPVLQPYANYINGNANWNASFSADGEAGTPGSQRMIITSNLRGVALTLPEPLKKDADRELPLRVTLGLPFAGGSLDLKLGDVMQVHGRLPTVLEPFAANVAFGTTNTATALPARGFLITGAVPRLDLSGWMEFANSDGGSGSSDNGMLAGIDLGAATLSAYERDFGETRFGLKTSSTGLDISLKGAKVDGTLRVPATDLHRLGITAQFAKLHWPELPDNENGSVSGENPGALPPLHIHVDDFKLGEANFGEATVESFPSGEGTHFEQVSTHSDNVEMRARGDWTGRSTADHSTFTIDFSAHNLGHMLDAFGNKGVVDGGATVAHIEGSWTGAPSAFALARLDGTLKVSVKEGRIPEYDPGAVRIFGLLNLAAIPRRLAFDFGDLFKSGYSFDSIEGLFTLKDGNAFTSNLTIKSPMADMILTGRMGLKAKDWDQIIDVTPHVGATLAIGGGLLGGPVGIAAGVLLQGVFRNQIAAVTRAKYKVSGSWKEPTVTVVAKDRAKPRKSDEKSPDGKTNDAKALDEPQPDPQRGR